MTTVAWKLEVLWLTILYRMLEVGEPIPLLPEGDLKFIEKDLDQMHLAGLIETREGSAWRNESELSAYVWHPTAKGEGVLKQMLAIYDQLFKFKIYRCVHVALKPPGEITDDHGNVMDHCYDPRFDATLPNSGDLGSEDLRIPMMRFMAEEFKAGEKLDPHRIVFMQLLAEGQLRRSDVWFDLKVGSIYERIEKIVASQYQWTDVAGTREEASEIMKLIYTAGQLEQRKRGGYTCSKCKIPLALFDPDLTVCPNPECQADFTPPAPTAVSLKCPRCHSYISAHKEHCGRCGALIDFSLPEGVVATDQAWTRSYDYVSYGLLHPYDPFVDQDFFAVAYGPLW